MIKEGTIKIERREFADQDALEEIIIPDSVIEIGDGAFSGCTALKKVVLPSELKVLSDNVFRGCTSLSEIQFPKSLKMIGSHCFDGCSSLKGIHFQEGMNIDWYSFRNCVSLKTVIIPENCTVGNLAFEDCKNLTSVRLPREAKITWNAFCGCSSLDVVYAPEDVDYHQLFKRLPKNCKVLNLDGVEVASMRMIIQEWDGEVPEEALPDIEKLQGLSLEEQLEHCYIEETTSEESFSYGESDGSVTNVSRIHLNRAYDFDILLVKNGSVVGFINMDGEKKFLGQICKSYSSVDSDGTGSTYSSSVSRLKVIDLS